MRLKPLLERHRGAEPIGSDRRLRRLESFAFALKVPSGRWTRAEGSPVCFADDGATAPLCAVQEAIAQMISLKKIFPKIVELNPCPPIHWATKTMLS